MRNYEEYPHDRRNRMGGNWDEERYDRGPLYRDERISREERRAHREDPYWSRDMERVRRIPADRDNRGNDPYYEPRDMRPVPEYDRNYNEGYGRDFSYRFEDSERWERQGPRRWEESYEDRRRREKDREEREHAPRFYREGDRMPDRGRWMQ
jgi:hypothetical protein